jgi:hypothetical protein
VTFSSSLAQSITTLSSSIRINSASLAASISQVNSTNVDFSSSLAQTITIISSSLSGNSASFASSIGQISFAFSNASGSLASSISVLSASVVTNSASLAGTVSTLSRVSSSLSGVLSEYVLKVSAGSRVAGFKLLADSSTSSSFIVEVDQFKIVNPNTTQTIVPFEVDGSSVKINNAYIKDLNASVITAGSISASRIGVGTISAAISINSPTITGGTLNIGSGVFQVASDGTLTATSATITGAITATSGFIGSIAGGFAINSTYIGKGKTSLTDANAGVYIGANGISLGASSVFTVTDAGVLAAKSGTIGGWTINPTTLTGGSTTLNADGTITCANLTANTAGTIGGWNINPTSLTSDGTNGGTMTILKTGKITGAGGFEIDCSSNQSYIKMGGSYPLQLTGGVAAATLTLGTNSTNGAALSQSGVLTLQGKEFKWNNATSKFNFGSSGTETIVCGTIEIGSGGLSCTGGGSFSGALAAESFNSTSSRKYKNNIRNLTNGLNIINNLRPVMFDWNDKDIKNDIGMIAEEVNEILPTIVYKNIKGEIDGLEYGKLVAVLTAAVKELTAEVQELKRQINQLKKY